MNVSPLVCLFLIIPVSYGHGLTGGNICYRLSSRLDFTNLTTRVTANHCYYRFTYYYHIESVCRTVYRIKFTLRNILQYFLQPCCCPNATQINDRCIVTTTLPVTTTTVLSTTISTTTTPSTTTITIPTTTTSVIETALPPLVDALNSQVANVGNAVGGVFGALVALALIALLAVFARRRFYNQSWKRDSLNSQIDTEQIETENHRQLSAQYKGFSALGKENIPYDGLHTYGNDEQANKAMYDQPRQEKQKYANGTQIRIAATANTKTSKVIHLPQRDFTNGNMNVPNQQNSPFKTATINNGNSQKLLYDLPRKDKNVANVTAPNKPTSNVSSVMRGLEENKGQTNKFNTKENELYFI